MNENLLIHIQNGKKRLSSFALFVKLYIMSVEIVVYEDIQLYCVNYRAQS